MNQQGYKRKFQVIPIDIPKAGSVVNLSTTTKTNHDEITGVALYKTGGEHGYGTFSLRIDGKELFDNSFHASIITLDAKNQNTVLNDVFWPCNQKARGSSVKLEYREPEEGAPGKLFLYLLAKEKTGNEG